MNLADRGANEARNRPGRARRQGLMVQPRRRRGVGARLTGAVPGGVRGDVPIIVPCAAGGIEAGPGAMRRSHERGLHAFVTRFGAFWPPASATWRLLAGPAARSSARVDSASDSPATEAAAALPLEASDLEAAERHQLPSDLHQEAFHQPSDRQVEELRQLASAWAAEALRRSPEACPLGAERCRLSCPVPSVASRPSRGHCVRRLDSTS